MEKIIKQLEEKAINCGTSNKESRARKGAYVDAIVIMKDALKKSDISKQIKLLKNFWKYLDKECVAVNCNEERDEVIKDFFIFSKQKK
jgi:hypothetical protein